MIVSPERRSFSTDVGATSSLVTSYIMEAGIEVPRCQYVETTESLS